MYVSRLFFVYIVLDFSTSSWFHLQKNKYHSFICPNKCETRHEKDKSNGTKGKTLFSGSPDKQTNKLTTIREVLWDRWMGLCYFFFFSSLSKWLLKRNIYKDWLAIWEAVDFIVNINLLKVRERCLYNRALRSLRFNQAWQRTMRKRNK